MISNLKNYVQKRAMSKALALTFNQAMYDKILMLTLGAFDFIEKMVLYSQVHKNV